MIATSGYHQLIAFLRLEKLASEAFQPAEPEEEYFEKVMLDFDTAGSGRLSLENFHRMAKDGTFVGNQHWNWTLCCHWCLVGYQNY